MEYTFHHCTCVNSNTYLLLNPRWKTRGAIQWISIILDFIWQSSQFNAKNKKNPSYFYFIYLSITCRYRSHMFCRNWIACCNPSSTQRLQVEGKVHLHLSIKLHLSIILESHKKLKLNLINIWWSRYKKLNLAPRMEHGLSPILK